MVYKLRPCSNIYEQNKNFNSLVMTCALHYGVLYGLKITHTY